MSENTLKLSPLNWACYCSKGSLDGYPAAVAGLPFGMISVEFAGPFAFGLTPAAAAELGRHLLAAAGAVKAVQAGFSHDTDAGGAQ